MVAANNTAVEIRGLNECLASFKSLQVELRKNANGELRAASKQIAAGIPGMLGGTGAPQESKIVAATGPKSDRYVVVAAPNRKPGLSGLKKTPARLAKTIGWALEAGSGEKQFHGPPAGGLVARHQSQMGAYAVPKYQAALAGIMRKYGLL